MRGTVQEVEFPNLVKRLNWGKTCLPLLVLSSREQKILGAMKDRQRTICWAIDIGGLSLQACIDSGRRSGPAIYSIRKCRRGEAISSYTGQTLSAAIRRQSYTNDKRERSRTGRTISIMDRPLVSSYPPLQG